MPINSFLYPGAKVVPPFTVANSLRFNDDDSPSLTRTQSSSPTHDDKGTLSFWFKIGNLSSGDGQYFFSVFTDSNNRMQMLLQSDNTLKLVQKTGGSTVINLVTNREFRDVSAWYHVVLACDSSQGTASNRIKIYINGVQETSFSTETYCNQNVDIQLVKGTAVSLGAYNSGASDFFDGYLAEMVLVDGQQLAQTSFGEFDEDSPTIWKPIDVTGLTFGTNGFYLDFEDSSSLGNDAAGSNNFTVNNLAATDQSTDTCSNNFCTWNPLIVRIGRTQPTFSEGNLKCQHNDTGGNTPSWGTFLLNSGKWYWEVKITSAGIIYCGVWQPGYNDGDVDDALNGIVVYRTDGNKQAETAATAASYGNSFTTGDIIGVAVDVDTGTIWFSKNGTWQNSATISEIGAGTTTNSAYTGKSFATNGILPAVSAYQQSGNAIIEANFGGGTSFSISSGNADANGFGNFEYPVPSGYFSLCSKNLGEHG